MKFSKDFFSGNRKRLVKAVPGSYILITANSVLQKSADVTYEFRQDSSFWYFTGIDQPDMVLGIDTKTGKSTLFLPEQNKYQKEWDGKFDQKEFKKIIGATKTLSRLNLDSEVRGALKRGLSIGYLKPLDERVEPYGFYSNPARKKLENELLSMLEAWPLAENEGIPGLVDVREEIARLRQVKQPEEIKALQKAIDITGEALAQAKKNLGKLKTEKDLERAITAEFYGRGADGHGYTPIVGGGKNAAIIHYVDNDSKLDSEDLVLLDVGATIGYYSADISRTWSVGGKPSKRQVEIYDAVIDLQQKAFDILGPGVKIRDYQKQMEKHAKKVAEKFGIKMEKYPHGFSHFLGLDLHDAGDYEAPLVENSVLTVEPGLYLLDEGIGVRIEDVVRITKDGIEIMSKNIPKDL